MLHTLTSLIEPIKPLEAITTDLAILATGNAGNFY